MRTFNEFLEQQIVTVIFPQDAPIDHLTNMNKLAARIGGSPIESYEVEGQQAQAFQFPTTMASQEFQKSVEQQFGFEVRQGTPQTGA